MCNIDKNMNRKKKTAPASSADAVSLSLLVYISNGALYFASLYHYILLQCVFYFVVVGAVQLVGVTVQSNKLPLVSTFLATMVLTYL